MFLLIISLDLWSSPTFSTCQSDNRQFQQTSNEVCVWLPNPLTLLANQTTANDDRLVLWLHVSSFVWHPITAIVFFLCSLSKWHRCYHNSLLSSGSALCNNILLKTQPHSFTPIHIVSETVLLGDGVCVPTTSRKKPKAAGVSEMGRTT